MEKENNIQLELFSQSGNNANNRVSSSFVNRIWRYEKAILIIIALAVTGIVSFSFGVEKGKRMVLSQMNAHFDVAAVRSAPLQKAVAVRVPEPAVIPVAAPVSLMRIKKEEARNADPGNQGFIIQLASYKTKSYAQKDAQVLKKQGFTPLVVSKGDFTILCVGTFSNKEKAQPLLVQLQKNYKGCYIRRL